MEGKTIDTNAPQSDEKKGDSLGSFAWFMVKLALIGAEAVRAGQRP